MLQCPVCKYKENSIKTEDNINGWYNFHECQACGVIIIEKIVSVPHQWFVLDQDDFETSMMRAIEEKYGDKYGDQFTPKDLTTTKSEIMSMSRRLYNELKKFPDYLVKNGDEDK